MNSVQTAATPSIFIGFDAANNLVIKDALTELGLPSDRVDNLAQEIMTSIKFYADRAKSLTVSLDKSSQIVSLELYGARKAIGGPLLSTAYPVYTFAAQVFEKLKELQLDRADIYAILSNLRDIEILTPVDVKLSVYPLDNMATIWIGLKNGITIAQYSFPLLE